MIWIIHTLGAIFMWPLFLITTIAHATWSACKLTWFMFTYPIRVALRLARGKAQ